MTDELVWIKKRGRVGAGTSITIHTDPGCRALQQAQATKEVERKALPSDWSTCSICTGTADTGGVPKGENTLKLRQRLEETDPDEL